MVTFPLLWSYSTEGSGKSYWPNTWTQHIIVECWKIPKHSLPYKLLLGGQNDLTGIHLIKFMMNMKDVPTRAKPTALLKLQKYWFVMLTDKYCGQQLSQFQDGQGNITSLTGWKNCLSWSTKLKMTVKQQKDHKQQASQAKPSISAMYKKALHQQTLVRKKKESLNLNWHRNQIWKLVTAMDNKRTQWQTNNKLKHCCQNINLKIFQFFALCILASWYE